jgi:hypothetical protein
MVSLEFFSDNLSGRTMALGLTQPLTEMSTWCISWGKGDRCVRLTTLPPSCAVVMKSGNFNFLELSGPLQFCKGTAFPPLFFTLVCFQSAQMEVFWSTGAGRTMNTFLLLFTHLFMCLYCIGHTLSTLMWGEQVYLVHQNRIIFGFGPDAPRP